jgi:hypothetical protein
MPGRTMTVSVVSGGVTRRSGSRALVVTVRVEGLGSAYALVGTVTVAAIVAAIAASIEIFTVAYFWSR